MSSTSWGTGSIPGGRGITPPVEEYMVLPIPPAAEEVEEAPAATEDPAAPGVTPAPEPFFLPFLLLAAASASPFLPLAPPAEEEADGAEDTFSPFFFLFFSFGLSSSSSSSSSSVSV